MQRLVAAALATLLAATALGGGQPLPAQPDGALLRGVEMLLAAERLSDPLRAAAVIQGFALPTVSFEPAADLHDALHDAPWPMSATEHAHAHDVLAKLPTHVAEAAGQLVSAASFCHREVEAAWAAVSAEDRAAAFADLKGPAMLAAAAKVDHARVLACAVLLADTLELATGKLHGAEPVVLADTCDPLTVSAVGVGVLSIGGLEANCYTANVIVGLDLGGDDVYTNEAGVSLYVLASWTPGIAADLGGNDRYTNRQGSGFGGAIGILVDAEGNDVYESMNRPSFQGTGQGTGVGFLVDLEGRDSYRCQYQCQGAGTSLGAVGILLDDGSASEASADDRYVLDMNYGISGQGFGSDLSVGMLIDRRGSDLYEAVGAAQAFAQSTGTGNLRIGTGVLLDQAGSDIYRLTYDGRAAPSIVGNALFLDLSGTDTYSGPSPGANDATWGPGLTPPTYKRGKDCESGADPMACFLGLL